MINNRNVEAVALDILQSGLRDPALGLEALTLSDAQLALFERYFALLVEWNGRFNLTSITEAAAVQTKHFLDSLVLASPHLRADPPGTLRDLNRLRLIDIGAGAGFPGLPLKIAYPDLRLTLVESVGKKTTFLKAVVAELGLTDVTVLNARAEEIAREPQHRQKYDIATGRALAALPVLAEYCMPFCVVGGLCIAPKTVNIGDELAAGNAAARKLGGRDREDTPVYSLPGDEAARRLIIFDKTAPTPPQFPRPIAQIKLKPLG